MGAYSVTTRTRTSTVVGIAMVVLFAAGLVLPAFASRGLIQDLFFILTMLSLAQFWNLLAGYGGLVSVGQQAFVGLGAYALFGATILTGVNPLLAVLLAGVIAALLAVPTAFFVFRLQGAYFAIGTWVVAEVFRLSVAQWKAVGGGTGTSLPRDTRDRIPGMAMIETTFDVRGSAAFDIVCYWLALVVAAATVGGIYWFLRTKRGLSLAALRDNDVAARSVGIDAQRMKWVVFLVAAFGTGIVGSLIFLQNGRVSPDSAFSVIDWTAFVIFIVVIGGIGTIEGPIIGVLVFFGLQTLLADYGSAYLLTLGALGVVVMLFAPRGIWGLISSRTDVQFFPIRRRLVLPDRIEAADENSGIR